MTPPEDELELKAVVPDSAAFRRGVLAAGAALEFAGMMRDQRFDQDGALEARDEVLRLRQYAPDSGQANAVMGWKGPTLLSPEGYKRRREIEYGVSDPSQAEAVFAALGYAVVQTIDRYVEVYRLAGGTLRLEWYPRMDVLLEVEGTPAAIEAGIRASGIERNRFLPDPLALFVERYEARTGTRGILAEAELAGAEPEWNRR